MRLTGEYFHSIDSKGRLVIPNDLKESLGERFYLVKGLEKCLTVYPESKWNELIQKIESLPISNIYARSLQRFFGSGARECQIDPQGRISIPTSLREHAMLKKKAAIVGVFNKIEIWDADMWEKTCSNDYKGESAMSEEFIQHITQLGV